MIKSFIIFLLILVVGYFGFNYYKDKKGIGFQNINQSFMVQESEDKSNNSNLVMRTDGTYEFNLCGVTKGDYEIISGIYNFKIKTRETTNSTNDGCDDKELQHLAGMMRGKYRVKKMESGALYLSNDNNDGFYLISIPN